MSRHLAILCLAGLLISCACAHSSARSPNSLICYPPAWGGLVPGFTEDRDVVTLFGPGLFTENLGHGGGRYYTDANRTATLIVEIGVDEIIEAVHLLAGLHVPDGVESAEALPVSPRFRPMDGFGKWGELRLGSTEAEVRANLGVPLRFGDEGKDRTLWVYDSEYRDTDCYAAASVSIRFRDGRVAGVTFYNGE